MNVSTTPFPTLQTNRLLLRKLVIDDIQELQRLRSDERVNKYLDRPATITIDEAEAYVHKIDRLLAEKACIYWAISLKNDKKLIGTICLWNFFPDRDLAELGYELSPAYHGQGIMQEAIEKVIDYGFEVVQLKVITALPNPSNEKSVNLLKRNHFQYDPDYRNVTRKEVGKLVVYFLKDNSNL